LLASIATVAETALQDRGDGEPVSTITVRGQNTEEVFWGVASFVGTVPPESLRRFRQVVVVTQCGLLVVTFTILRQYRLRRGEKPEASLTVAGPRADRTLISVTEAVVAAAARGYRVYWGDCQLPEPITGSQRYKILGKHLRTSINCLVGFVMGVLAFFLASTLH
jgi:hypothetical protein